MEGPSAEVIKEQKSIQKAIWFNRLMRWLLGVLFMGVGVAYHNDGAWPAIMFGVILMVTGFLKPRRCIDGSCRLPLKQ